MTLEIQETSVLQTVKPPFTLSNGISQQLLISLQNRAPHDHSPERGDQLDLLDVVLGAEEAQRRPTNLTDDAGAERRVTDVAGRQVEVLSATLLREEST